MFLYSKENGLDTTLVMEHFIKFVPINYTKDNFLPAPIKTVKSELQVWIGYPRIKLTSIVTSYYLQQSPATIGHSSHHLSLVILVSKLKFNIVEIPIIHHTQWSNEAFASCITMSKRLTFKILIGDLQQIKTSFLVIFVLAWSR